MNIVVTAPRGKMGKLIVKAAAEHQMVDVKAGIGPASRPYIGQDAGLVAGLGYELGAPVLADIGKAIDGCDVVIDFSTVELTMQVLSVAVAAKKPLIIGTTGFDEEQLRAIRAASGAIPLLKASNTSYVVNVMKELLALAARSLDGKADFDIIEMHDRMKKDAPSGTALEMGETLAEALGGAAEAERIRYHSIRSGDISSSHAVLFGCIGERMEISHHAQNWECFARGAIDAARFLKNQPAGYYTMQDVIRSAANRG